MRIRIVLAIAALAIFCAGYFGIFEKKKGGYDNYAFKGDTYYADYGQKGYDNVWGASDYDPYFGSSWDDTDNGVTNNWGFDTTIELAT